MQRFCKIIQYRNRQFYFYRAKACFYRGDYRFRLTRLAQVQESIIFEAQSHIAKSFKGSQPKPTAPIRQNINTKPANEKEKAVQTAFSFCTTFSCVHRICRTFNKMACEFSIPFSGEPTAVLSKAQASVESQGGTFTGDAAAGAFDVTVFGNTIQGRYAVSGQTLLINILSKPFFLPCSTIEGFLQNQLGGSWHACILKRTNTSMGFWKSWGRIATVQPVLVCVPAFYFLRMAFNRLFTLTITAIIMEQNLR